MVTNFGLTEKAKNQFLAVLIYWAVIQLEGLKKRI
jgi:hypothetical protein